MRSSSFNDSPKPVKSRLGLKLGALFVGVFLAVFIGLLFFDLLFMFGDQAKIEATAANPVAAIDPKLESDLAKVLEFKDAQNTADIKNPFADSSGISGAANNSRNVVTQTSATTKNAAVTEGRARTDQPQKSSRQNIAARTTDDSQNDRKTEPQIDTRMRLQLREEKIRLGQDPGPEALAFAIDDLLPVGVVGGGDGKDEIMFYSTSACRVVSFPVGTQFYDGWLDAQRPDGVVFGFFDQDRTMRMRGWGRSVSTGCSENISTNAAEQSLTNGGGN